MEQNSILKIKCHYQEMPTPKKAYERNSGIDLTLMQVLEKRDGVYFFDLGVSIEPPSGYYAELYTRSSIYKTDFIMVNSVGIIDSDYRGKIFMPMRYLGNRNGRIEAEKLLGYRVAQIILKPLHSFSVKIVSNIGESKRGARGFGSRGE